MWKIQLPGFSFCSKGFKATQKLNLVSRADYKTFL